MRTILEISQRRLKSQSCPFCSRTLTLHSWWNSERNVWEARHASCLNCMKVFGIVGKEFTVDSIGYHNLHLVA